MNGDSTLLVWRLREFRPYPLSPFMILTCPWCDTATTVLETETRKPGYAGPIPKRGRGCPLCGWHLLTVGNYYGSDISSYKEVTLLREFDLNSAEVALEELGAHLRRKFSDAYTLDWRRFEELVCDVFKRHGFFACLTRPSCDDGADIVLFSRDGRTIDAIVECKRLAERRTVGVHLVRALLGAKIFWDARRAALVTVNDVSRNASEFARAVTARGHEVTLVDGSNVLSLLGVYNPSMPSLDRIDGHLRQRIAEEQKHFRWLVGGVRPPLRT